MPVDPKTFGNRIRCLASGSPLDDFLANFHPKPRPANLDALGLRSGMACFANVSYRRYACCYQVRTRKCRVDGMALDHYVSQVHLKNFYSPALSGMMYAIRKSDLKRFQTRSQDVCRIEEGSTNAYLSEDRAIEEFLKVVEPRYNASLAKRRENNIDQECILCIAGFAAYVVACSPAAMRIESGPMKMALESAATVLDGQGLIPQSPEALDKKSITELLADGTVTVSVDPKYPQAVGISNILHYVSVFGNSPCEILRNEDADSPFFTSDYPAAIETFDLNTPINRVVPLSPDLAIRIIPDIRLSGTKQDLSFPKFGAALRRLKRTEVVDLNRLIVRCAEDLILYRDDREWVKGFVAKNQRYRIEPVTQKLSTGTGDLLVSTQRIRLPDYESPHPQEESR